MFCLLAVSMTGSPVMSEFFIIYTAAAALRGEAAARYTDIIPQFLPKIKNPRRICFRKEGTPVSVFRRKKFFEKLSVPCNIPDRPVVYGAEGPKRKRRADRGRQPAVRARIRA